MRLYVITRSDLSARVRAAQICQAVYGFFVMYPVLLPYWYKGACTLSVLVVRNESALLAVLQSAVDARICFAVCKGVQYKNALTVVIFRSTRRARKLIAALLECTF